MSSPSAREAEVEADATLRAYDAMSERAQLMFRLKLRARNMGATWTPDYARLDRCFERGVV